jgi:hypothetical protein
MDYEAPTIEVIGSVTELTLDEGSVLDTEGDS